MRYRVSLLVSLVTLLAAIDQASSQGEGRTDRFLTPALRAELTKMPGKRAPQFVPGVDRQAKREHVARIDQALAGVHTPPGLADSVRLWQSLSVVEKEQLLTNGRVRGIAPAAVVAVAVALAVAVDYDDSVGSKDFLQRPLDAEELDTIDRLGRTSGFAYGSGRAVLESVDSAELDYAAP
mgnify:CR=1 FL=1